MTFLTIKRKRGDTRRIVFTIEDSNGVVVPIDGWSGFLLTVDPDKYPADDTANLGQFIGVLISDGLDGRIGFTPSGNIAAGNYFYDAQALDANSEKITFAEGCYKLSQDITKD